MSLHWKTSEIFDFLPTTQVNSQACDITANIPILKAWIRKCMQLHFTISWYNVQKSSELLMTHENLKQHFSISLQFFVTWNWNVSKKVTSFKFSKGIVKKSILYLRTSCREHESSLWYVDSSYYEWMNAPGCIWV